MSEDLEVGDLITTIYNGYEDYFGGDGLRKLDLNDTFVVLAVRAYVVNAIDSRFNRFEFLKTETILIQRLL